MYIVFGSDPQTGWATLSIIGDGFKPLEQVSLKIVVTAPGGNPQATFEQTTADSLGRINFKYGVVATHCDPTNATSYQVQGTGLTSGKQSNVAIGGC